MISRIKREDYNTDEEYQEAYNEMLKLIKEHDEVRTPVTDPNNPHICHTSGTIKVLKK